MATTASNANSRDNSSVTGRKWVDSGSADICSGSQLYGKNSGFVAEIETQDCSDARRGLRAQARKMGCILAQVGIDPVAGLLASKVLHVRGWQNDHSSD
jgi:hypothetical protein